MDTAHHAYTSAHYGPRAQQYLDSATHAAGEDLDQIAAFAARWSPAAALDLGCGGGHVAYRLAPHAGQVVACDLSAEMLTVVAREAAARGLANITTRQAPAELLPFADASFDMVVCRYSAHHWPDLAAGLRQARRVLKPAGRALFVDTVAPSAPLLDSYMQTMELLRDPTHVRNPRAEEWVTTLAQAGFALTGATARRLRLAFAPWTARTTTPPPLVAALRHLQQQAPAEVRAHFEIEPDGSWTLDKLALEVVAA